MRDHADTRYCSLPPTTSNSQIKWREFSVREIRLHCPRRSLYKIKLRLPLSRYPRCWLGTFLIFSYLGSWFCRRRLKEMVADALFQENLEATKQNVASEREDRYILAVCIDIASNPRDSENSPRSSAHFFLVGGRTRHYDKAPIPHSASSRHKNNDALYLTWMVTVADTSFANWFKRFVQSFGAFINKHL